MNWSLSHELEHGSKIGACLKKWSLSKKLDFGSKIGACIIKGSMAQELDFGSKIGACLIKWSMARKLDFCSKIVVWVIRRTSARIYTGTKMKPWIMNLSINFNFSLASNFLFISLNFKAIFQDWVNRQRA